MEELQRKKLWGEASAVAIAPNGDIIVAGYIRPHGFEDEDYFWVLRLDEDGNVKWQKTYGGGKSDGAYAVAIAPNGDIIVAGYTKSFGSDYEDAWIIRLDANGDVKWQKAYGVSDNNRANTIALTSTGDIIVAGEIFDSTNSCFRMWLFEVDKNGSLKWGKLYRKGAFTAIDLAPDGDIIVTGYEKGIEFSNIYVLRIPPQGLFDSYGYPGPDFQVKNTSAFVKVTHVIPKNLKADVRASKGIIPKKVNITAKTIFYMNTTSTLKITSSPSGASVYVNGSYRGTTPLSLNLNPGSYTIKLVRDSYKKYDTEVRLSIGEVKTISVKLTPMFGYLDVESKPSGAKVYIGKKYIGNTPVRKYKLPVGQYEVKITKNGYNDYVKTVSVKPGEITTIEAELSAAKAILKIDSTPSGASVYINGTYRGRTPLTITLNPGKYQIKLTKEDYEHYITEITLDNGESKVISIKLSSIPITSALAPSKRATDTITNKQKKICGPGLVLLLLLIILLYKSQNHRKI